MNLNIIRLATYLLLSGAITSEALATPTAPPTVPSSAAESFQSTHETGLQVVIGKGRLVRLGKPASTVIIADPAIAEAKALTPTMIWVFGKSVGVTELTAVSKGSTAVATIPLNVLRSALPAQNAAAQAVRLSHRNIPELAFAGNRLVLSGRFDGPGAAETAMRAAQPFVPPHSQLLDLGTMQRSPQITLRVRIAEVSRSALQQLGVNWNVLAHPGRFTASLLTGTMIGQALSAASFGAASVGYQSGPVSVNTLINALSQHGALRMLAEPNLTTLSGEDASFLAGGQIPIPVPQSFGVTTIDYKTYGVALNFTPTLLANGRIALHVQPEVTAISAANSVTIGGVSVPAFTTERAETNVEMESGQTIAIAGLFQKNQQSTINGIPALGDLPVIGPLFKSTQFQDDQTELVILITPYVTRPVRNPAHMAVPTARLRAALTGDLPNHGRVTAGFGVN